MTPDQGPCDKLTVWRMLMSELQQPVRVVVVEDDALTLARLVSALQADVRVEVAAAFDRWRAAHDWLHGHGCDVLLTDIGLPDGSGIELVRTCARLQPSADIMIVSMFADDQNVLACIEAGAAGYILKDAHEPDIVQSILTLRAGGSPMSPLIARRLLQRLKAGGASAGKAPGVPAPAPDTPDLTTRESDTLRLIARGYAYKEVAEMLGVSVSTIQTHIKNMYRKLSVNSRSEAVFEAQALGLLRDVPPGSR